MDGYRFTNKLYSHASFETFYDIRRVVVLNTSHTFCRVLSSLSQICKRETGVTTGHIAELMEDYFQSGGGGGGVLRACPYPMLPLT